MDSSTIFNSTYHHHSYDATQHCQGVSLVDEKNIFPDTYVPNAASRSSGLPSVQRFLDQQDRTLFMPSISAFDQHAMHAFPEVPMYVEGHGTAWSDHRRLPSPTNSGGEGSSYESSEHSGRAESTTSSPYMTARLCSPGFDLNDGFAHAYGGHPPMQRHDSHSPGACVALHDVQKCADELPETFAFGGEPMGYQMYGSCAQEGYQPMQSGDDTTSGESYSTPGTDYPHEEETPQQQEPSSPNIRRRRPQVPRTLTNTSPLFSNRVSKRPIAGRRTSSTRSGTYSDSAYATTTASWAFPCPLAIYGCTSTFGSKNEWKRHVSTQHMRLGFWRCDQCTNLSGDRKTNDFNRKDLFVQHVRRMHLGDTTATTTTTTTTTSAKKSRAKKESSEEQVLQEAAKRCYRYLRMPPQESRCLFCEHTFQGPDSWDARMEHVGRHMEGAKKEGESPANADDWQSDEEAQRWFLKQRVIVSHGSRFFLTT